MKNYQISSVLLVPVGIFFWGMTFLFPSQVYSATPNFKINYPSLTKPIYSEDDQIIISEQAQKEISAKIFELNKELKTINKLFDIPLNQKVGLVYIHTGQDYWIIKLTYGGFVVDISDYTTYSTEEIFALKKVFEMTKTINIEGKYYETTGSMRQLGPMLHKDR